VSGRGETTLCPGCAEFFSGRQVVSGVIISRYRFVWPPLAFIPPPSSTLISPRFLNALIERCTLLALMRHLRAMSRFPGQHSKSTPMRSARASRTSRWVPSAHECPQTRFNASLLIAHHPVEAVLYVDDLK
jgi:hypothetical protein